MDSQAKITLREAASSLETLCEELDDLEKIGPLLEKLFEEKEEDLKKAVDRRIRYFLYLNASIEQAKQMRDAWIKRARILESAKHYIEENTKFIMAGVNGLKFKGDLGELRVQKNSVPTLKIPKELSNIEGKFLEPEQAESLGVYKECLKLGYKFSSTLVKEKLKDGQDIPGFSLEYGSHVRIKT